jgi:hypothetical protein
MTNITYAIEPNRLKMIWQSSTSTTRTKFVVGELVRAEDKVSLSYFRISSDFLNAISIGFVGHPAFRIDTPVHHHNVIEVFSKRLPPRNRADFQAYLSKNRLENIPSISNFALLGYTGGHLPGDGFSFAIDFCYENLPYQFLMEVAGFRYYSGMNVEISAMAGQLVNFEPESTNLHDPFAVKIMFMGTHIGYVPRYYAPLVRYWLNHCRIFAIIERIDGTLTKPQVHLMMHVLSKSNNQLT